jgi:hypothetical protein
MEKKFELKNEYKMMVKKVTAKLHIKKENGKNEYDL